MTRTARGDAQIADTFRHSPEHTAREVTKLWHAEHPDWTPDQVLFTYEYLLEIYRQAWAWWSEHPRATEEQVKKIYHEIVKAHLRGERLIPIPNAKQRRRHDIAERRVEHDALWNTYSPAEKAGFDYRGWLVAQRALGRRPRKRAKQAAREFFLRWHVDQPVSSHPIPSEILGLY
jgi:hypothetical protein